MGWHRYLRAYMAGIVVPTVTTFLVAPFVVWHFFRIPDTLERAMLFPIAVNPLMWGAWNGLYTVIRRTHRVSIGWFGAALPLLLVPVGALLARYLHISAVTPMRAAAVLPPTMLAYYVIWRYVVAFLNGVVGLGA